MKRILLFVLLAIVVISCDTPERHRTKVEIDTNYTFTNPNVVNQLIINQMDTVFNFNSYGIPIARNIVMHASTMKNVTDMSPGSITVDTAKWFVLRVIPLDSLDYELINTRDTL